MLTKWGQKVAATRIYNQSNKATLPAISVTNTSAAYIEAKTIDGDRKFITPVVYINYNLLGVALISTGSSASYGIAFGAGNTPPTDDNYTLDNQITNISVTLQTGSPQTIFDQEQHKYIARIELNVTNDNNDSITIREIGWFFRTQAANVIGESPETGVANQYCFMHDRTVLNTPVTIASGETGKIYYEFAY